MTSIRIEKGLNIPLAGAPTSEIIDVPPGSETAVYQEIEGLKARLRVKEGDAVKCGSPLFIDKKQPDLTFCSPVTGTVRAIEYGPRRALYRLLIDAGVPQQYEPFEPVDANHVCRLDRSAVLAQLLRSGLLSLIRQRPFSRVADPAITPKAIFINGMNTAPFTPDLHVAVKGRERAFQAGLDLMTRLTEGAVHLCLPEGTPDEPQAVSAAQNVNIHRFSGPHPSGNTSVHIHHIDPMEPHDVVWAVKAVDLIRIGELFLEGRYPTTQMITLAGPAVLEASRAHYRVQIGTPLSALLDGHLADGEMRIIAGDVLSGTHIKPDEHVRSTANALTVIAEGREQYFMGWMAPGINKFSVSRAYLSGWTGHRRKWNLTSNLNGSYRSMVLTGLYDQYVPLDIMVDYLVRAVLANDTDEAIKLGILSTDPEDFALCSYVCPSKMDICGIIQQGLAEIEKEGI